MIVMLKQEIQTEKIGNPYRTFPCETPKNNFSINQGVKIW